MKAKEGVPGPALESWDEIGQRQLHCLFHNLWGSIQLDLGCCPTHCRCRQGDFPFPTMSTMCCFNRIGTRVWAELGKLGRYDGLRVGWVHAGNEIGS